MKVRQKVLLIILDGWGLSPIEEGNAPMLAKTPTLDYIYSVYPKASLSASGLEVGLHPGEAGNSEVGHLNIGSGRVVWEDLPRIDQMIESGDFAKNEVLLEAIEHAKKNDSTLHIWGLMSDGGVHSHLNHALAILQLAAKNRLKNVLIHFVADGRDTEPKVALNYVKVLEEGCHKNKVGRIATIVGRYYGMDRDNNWDRTQKAYDLIIQNIGEPSKTAAEAVSAAYQTGESDEFLKPRIVGEGGKISDNDAVILINFRPDRARQMTELLSASGTVPINHQNPSNLFVCTMKKYSAEQTVPEIIKEINLENCMAELISRQGGVQYHIAETEKYAHVTYFIDAGHEKPYPGEIQIMVPSKKIATYDKAPEMRAVEIGEKVIEAINKEPDFIIVNFANGDMVGHTGNLEAAKEACEVVDTTLNRILADASLRGFTAIITADHGNCEVMINDRTHEVDKEHDVSPVPFVLMDFNKTPFKVDTVAENKDEYAQYASLPPIGILADIAPTVLSIMGIEKPKEMTGMDLTTAL